MNANDYSGYFLCPEEASHRRYEALRSVFVDEDSMLEVAERFEVSYGTIRNWVSDFCRSYDADQLPPFSFLLSEVAPHVKSRLTNNKKSRLPILGGCRWKPEGGW